MLAKKNHLTAGKKLQADQAARLGDLSQAHALFSSVCKTDPMDTEAWVKMALIEKQLGDYLQAERHARHALLLNAKLGYAHYVLGQILHSQNQRPEAILSYRTAISLMPDLADAHYLLGLALHEHGAMADAIASLQQALRLRPIFPEALADIGAACLDLGQVDEGLAYLRHAAALRPNDPIVLGNISHALRLQGKNHEALQQWRHVLSLVPENVDVIAGLSGQLEKLGQTDEADQLIRLGLQLAPEHVAANLVAAQLERRSQRLPAAIERLQGLLTTALTVDLAADIRLELGQIYDQMGDADRAYPMIIEGKRQKAMATLRNAETQNVFLERLAKIRQLATPELSEKLNSERQSNVQLSTPADTCGRQPVFLIGFPRSGTTLMEQILDSHPDIQAMEEKSTVACVVKRVLEMLDQQQCSLSELSDGQITELRAVYFSEVASHLKLQPGNTLIDKMPLNLIGVPIIARVFPDAKFILAIRHPCDVVLSCLMQNFAVNGGMANFYTLENTAHLYAEAMKAWLFYAGLLPLNYHQIRYEDLIEDLPVQARGLLDFLGLDWHDAVLKHTEHARQRGAINTPSYHQVVQPIYQRSKYRWKRYEQSMAEVLPTLQPFIKKFGYA